MKKNIAVKYLSGAGNIFTVIDNRKYGLTRNDLMLASAELVDASKILNQATEGIIVMNESVAHDFEVWFYNPDGSTGMMCGNGGRCAINYAINNGFLPKYSSGQLIKFEMNGRCYSGFERNGLFSIYFSPPENISEIFEIVAISREFKGRYINVGNDHFVAEVEDVETINIDLFGKEIRFNELFMPHGVNVSFYKSVDYNLLKMRTYERGVEKETGACGTASISVAVAYMIAQEMKLHSVTIVPTSGSKLYIEANLNNDNEIEYVLLTGEVVELGENIVAL